MEHEILRTLTEKVDLGKKVALITLIRRSGTSPSVPGMIMAVLEDETFGTIGGGALEYQAVLKARECLKKGEGSVEYFENTKCTDGREKVGSSAEVYIKIFKPRNKLLIVGCGHVGTNIYNVAKTQKFRIVLFDDREQMCNEERFPDAEIVFGNVPENLKNYDIDRDTYIVVSRHSHDADEEALETVLGRNAGYIGMLGSRKKIQKISSNLVEKGISEEEIKKVYAPIGIDVGTNSPDELAVGVIAQILMVKNESEKSS